MIVVWERIRNEPAVFLGLLASVLILVLQLANQEMKGVDDVIEVLSPLASSLGIRQMVTPTAQLPGPPGGPPPAPGPTPRT